MGWDFRKGATKQDIIDEFKAPFEGDTQSSRVVASSLRGRTLWLVEEVTTKDTGARERFITCVLLQNDPDYGWGSKVLSESSGPGYYDCPVEFLSMAPVKDAEWRANVRRLGVLWAMGARA